MYTLFELRDLKLRTHTHKLGYNAAFHYTVRKLRAGTVIIEFLAPGLNWPTHRPKTSRLCVWSEGSCGLPARPGLLPL